MDLDVASVDSKTCSSHKYKESILVAYSDLVRENFLAVGEDSWFQLAFETFSTEPGLWGHFSIGHLLSTSITDTKLGEHFLFYGFKTLYNLLLRLGSYPYHMQACEHLTMPILRNALVILLRRDDLWIGTDISQEIRDQRFRRLLFQCIAEQGAYHAETQREDDEDLIAVAQMITSHRIKNKCRAERKSSTPLELPKIGAMPSSLSQQLDGTILKKDIHPFIGLLLSCQLHPDKIDSRKLTAASEEESLATATVCATSAFDLDPENPNDAITWHDFNWALKEQLPSLCDSFARVFAALILPRETSSLHQTQPLTADLASHLSNLSRFGDASRVDLPKCLNLSRLAQIAALLPAPSISWSNVECHSYNRSNPVFFRLLNIGRTLKDAMEMAQKSSGWRDHLMVIIGSIPGTCSEQSSEDLILGAWYHRGAEVAVVPRMVFQCAPVQRSFRGLEPLSMHSDGIHSKPQPMGREALVLAGRNSHACEIRVQLRGLHDQRGLVTERNGAHVTTKVVHIEHILVIGFGGRSQSTDVWLHSGP